MRRQPKSVNNIPFRQVITSFSGLRAHEDGDDFIIGEAEDAPGFFDAAGIESPGLSCAPAIGEYLAGMIEEKAGFGKNPNFNPVRKGIVKAARLNTEERAELIRKNPAYGAIVCRCETISEGRSWMRSPVHSAHARWMASNGASVRVWDGVRQASALRGRWKFSPVRRESRSQRSAKTAKVRNDKR